MCIHSSAAKTCYTLTSLDSYDLQDIIMKGSVGGGGVGSSRSIIECY